MQRQAGSFLVELIFILLSLISQGDSLIISEMDYKGFHCGGGVGGGGMGRQPTYPTIFLVTRRSPTPPHQNRCILPT